MAEPTPLRVASLRVEGAKNTRRSFLNQLVLPHLSQQPEDIIQTAKRVGQILHDTDIFRTVDFHVEKSQGPLAREGDIDLIFTAHEKGRFFLNTSTEVGNGEGSAKVTGRIRNAFGGAEVLEGNVSFGTTTRHAYHALFSAPLSSTLKTWGELSVFELERDNYGHASCYEGLKGMRAAIRTRSNGCNAGSHELAYEAVLRHIRNLSPAASISMREAAGQTIKSSLSHTWIYDTRNDRLMATRGFMTKLFHEFAGLGGQASFYKVEMDGQISRPVVPGVAISFAARTGFLWSFHQPSLFSDRFQLGGPVSIRSFKANGLGPRDGLDSLGGDLYWSAGLSLISSIPGKPNWPVKTHTFINAGRLGATNQGQNLGNTIRDCILKPSISFGLGLIYLLDSVRVEMNFGLPLATSKDDGRKRGIQVGIGLDFL